MIFFHSITRWATALLLLLATVAAQGAADYRQMPLEELRRLAAEGDPAAQVELGQALQYGEGVKRDSQEARTWYCRAAARGSSRAAYALGWLFATDDGELRDDRLAAHWLGIAAAAGDEHAARLLRRLPAADIGAGDGCGSVATAPWLEQRCGDADCRRIVALVERLSAASGIEANLILAVIAAESDFDPRARSRKGALGLMQLIPATARRFGVTDVWDPEQNIRGGIAYLRWLLAYFEGDLERVLAGYNAGEHRVRRYRGVPPFSETRRYVRRILRDYGKRRHPFRRAWLEQAPPVGDAVVENGRRQQAKAQG